jgi:ribosomal protein S14
MKKHKYYYREKINIVVKPLFKKFLLKAIKYNVRLSKSLRQRAMNKLINLSIAFNLNKLKKFCISTGRLRFIVKNSKYSRMVFREYASLGFLLGYMKNG